MQLDDEHFGEEQLPRTFADVCVNGRPFKLWTMIPSGIVLAWLLYELHREASLTTMMLIVFIGMNSYAMLAAVFRPPQMAIRNGRFSLRFGQMKFVCPAADVAELHREAQAVYLTLSDTRRVEPSSARRQTETLYRTRGFHSGIPAGIYSLEQVNQVRTALGMSQQEADPAGEHMAEFQRSLQSHRPLVTASLITACVAVYLLQAFFDKSLLGGNIESLVAWGANYGPRTLGGQWWRLVTHLFLHCHPVHILMNMWVLWDVGRLMERLVGHTAMAMIYFLAGVAGGMASVAFHPNVVSAGASGAIFGIIGALFGLLLHARDVVPPARLQQLRSAIIAMVIFSVFFGMSVQVDNAAHAGGAIAGLLAGLILMPAMAPGHWLRIGILGVVGAGAILLCSRFLPPPPPDSVAVIKQFPGRQAQILGVYNDLIKNHLQGDLSDVEFAKRLETEVVVPWREFAAESTDVMKDRLDPSRRAKFERYMWLRQQSFEDLLAAVRENDDERSKKSLKEAEDASKIADEMNAQDEEKR